jgi:hypothetical protein
MISPQKLIYNNEEINSYLNPLEVILDVAFDSDNGETSAFLNRSAVASESYDGRYKNTIRYKYDELFSPKFTIVKKDFSDFTQSEVRQVLKYFTQIDRPALLEVDYDKEGEEPIEERNWCAIGGWTEISTYKLANNRTVGIVATFEAITPHAMSTLYTVPINSTTSYKATINIDTDDNQPVYPRVIIKSYGADIKFINKHTGLNRSEAYASIVLSNNTSGEEITVDGANKIIKTSLTKRIFGDDFNWKWLELYDGKNEITVEGNCEVILEWRCVRKVGEY